MLRDESERLLFIYASLIKDIKDERLALANFPHIFTRAVGGLARVGYQHGWVTSLRMVYWGVRDLLVKKARFLFFIRYPYAHLRIGFGLRPISYLWGLDRGVPIHRYYVEQFLQEFSADIRGHSLEFQDDSYTSRFGAARVTKRDILHKEYGNPNTTNVNATIVADITRPNNIASAEFDCLICTYVLNFIDDVEAALRELCRILKPGGVLLAAVPQINMAAPYGPDLWRWTPEGFQLQLARSFGQANVTVRAYGNSLTAAGDIRGLVADEFTKSQLDYLDSRFGIVVCARAVKPTETQNVKSQKTVP
jgi:SAM-dependent methyltransferase